MRWTLLAVLFVAACASTAGDDTTAQSAPSSLESAVATTERAVDVTGSSVDGVVPDGFERAQAVVTTADGSTCEICVWVADTAPQRSRGLMFVTDLGAADAMAFVYPGPHTGTFWMKNTLLPLSIAFFASDGAFLTSFDMEPCTEAQCPKYRTADDFLVAVEVPQGELAEFGLVEGSSLALLALPCDD